MTLQCKYKKFKLKINVIAKSGQERSRGLAHMKFKGYFQDKKIKNSSERNSQAMSEIFLAFITKVSGTLFWAVNFLCQWNCYWSNHDIQKHHFDVFVTNIIWKSQLFCRALVSYLCVPMPEWNYKFRELIPVFQTSEKNISLTPRGMLTLIYHFRTGLEVLSQCAVIYQKFSQHQTILN